MPASLDTTQCAGSCRASRETMDGVVTGETVDLAPATGRGRSASAATPFPGTPDPTQICLKHGFDPNLLYQVVFTAKDPLRPRRRLCRLPRRGVVLPPRRQGRRRHAQPARRRSQVGDHPRLSQSGNFLRGFLHLGFNQDEAGRQVHDGAVADHRGAAHRAQLPLGPARRRAGAVPDGQRRPAVVGQHEARQARGLPARSILDRCTGHAAPARRSSSTSARRRSGR